jgi:hypothetical protein
MSGGKPADWNVELARQLYDYGLTYPAIAARCGTTKWAVASQARRYWPPRTKEVEWDTVLARTLYDQGMSYRAIAKKCGVTKNAVMRRAKDYWPIRPGDAERFAKHFPKRDPDAPKVPKARPLLPGERTLPDLPSLRGYY